MSSEKIKICIKQLPTLTDFGVGIYANGKGLSTSEKEIQFKEEQLKLINNVDSFHKTCKWLSDIQQIKSINTRRTSYGLKSLAERDIGYITNGVFIAAAIHCGFKFKVDSNSPNVSFNISEKSLKLLEKT